MKKIDESGYWILKANPISRVGVFDYLGSQIDLDGKLGLEKNRRYGVLRPAGELFDKQSMESMEGIPLIEDHEMLGEGFTPVEKRPSHGTITNVRESLDEPGVLIADIKIYTRTIKDKIEGGKKGLSLGYYCAYEPEVGVYEGKTFDFVQKNLRGNHLALVDRPRNDVYVQDSAIGVTVMAIDSAIEEIPMKNKIDGKESPEDALTKLLTGQDSEACQATLDFLKDYLEKRKNGGKGKENATQDNNGGTPPPPPKKPGEGEGAQNAGGGEGGTAGAGEGGAAAGNGGEGGAAAGAGAGEGGAAGTGAGAGEGGAGAGEGEGKQKPNATDGGAGNGQGEGKGAGEGGAAGTGTPTVDCGGKGCEDPACKSCHGKGKSAVAQDEALAARKKFFSEFAKARDLADKIAPLTGAFDSAEMSESEVAVYGCKKLGIAFDEEDPSTAVFAIHAALKYAGKPAKKAAPAVSMDASPSTTDDASATKKCCDEYFKN